MDTFKEQQKCTTKSSADLTVSTIDRGNIVTSQLEPIKRAVYFENALEETKFGKFNYALIFISGLIFENTFIEVCGISFVLPVSQCDLNLSNEERGILGAIGTVGVISSSLLWGFLADIKGRRNVIRPTLLLGFLATVLSSFAINFWMLVILRFINGFFISGGSATIFAYLGEFHTSKNRSRAIMASSFIFGILGLLMPAIAWLIINQEWQFFIPILGITYKPWRLFILACGLPGLICGLCLYKIPESPKFYLAQGNEKKCLQILQRIFQINRGKPISDYPITHVIEDLDSMLITKKFDKHTTNQVTAFLHLIWDQIQPLFNTKYLRTTLLICSIQFGIFFTYSLYMWFPYIFNNFAEFIKDNPDSRTSICQAVYVNQHSITEPASTNPLVDQCNEKLEISTYKYSLAIEVLFAVGFALIGVIINTVEKVTILFVCLVVCGTCGIAVAYVNIPTVSIYLFITLMLCALSTNVLSAATIDLYPTKLRAMAVSLPQMVGRLGIVVGTNVIAAIIDNNCDTVFLASGGTLIFCGILGTFISKPKKTKVTLDVEQDVKNPRKESQIND